MTAITMELRHRSAGKWWSTLVMVLTTAGIFLSVDQVFSLKLFVGYTLLETRYLYLLLSIFLVVVFIIFPATKRAKRHTVPWYDILLALTGLVVPAYFAWHVLDIRRTGWEFAAPTEATVLSVVLWGLIMEAVRRAGGKELCIFTVVLSLYPVYAVYLPAFASGFGFSVTDAAAYHVMSGSSLIGLPMSTFGSLIIGFILFGAALYQFGGATFFINFASAFLGHHRGGPAKVSILASALFGTLSGSAVSNVISTGCITIPTMKRLGYPSEYAGAVEACASTGGVLMPPVMGAAAFLMASTLGVPYVHVMVAAVIPSILYYLSLFIQVDGKAAQIDLRGQPRHELPSARQTLKEGWYFFFVLLLLVFFLVYLRLEARAPYYATALLMLLANINKETRLTFRRVLEFIAFAGRQLAELVAILAAVGFIVGAVTMTGLGPTISSDILRIGGGTVPMLLLLGAVTAFVLGMGVTVSVCYIILAVTLAPALVGAGINPMAAHMYVLYWGIISCITPPVALASFAAATIAQANPMRVGFAATRLGATIYLVPVAFVLNPMLVAQGVSLGTLGEFLFVFIKSIAAVILIGSGIQGYLIGAGDIRTKGVFSIPLRLLLGIGGTAILLPGLQYAGLAMSAAAVLVSLILRRAKAEIGAEQR